MPQFPDPFIGKVPERKITLEELVRAIRLDLAAEEEAVHLYMAQADATENRLARKVLVDIADEERVHAGEFLRLLHILTGDEDKWMAQGAGEVDKMASEIGAPAPASAEEPTIGSIKE